jgi:hypothetical protein
LDWGLNSELHAYKASILPLELGWVFFKMVSQELFVRGGFKLCFLLISAY